MKFVLFWGEIIGVLVQLEQIDFDEYFGYLGEILYLGGKVMFQDK